MHLPDQVLLVSASVDIPHICSCNCYPLRLVEVRCHVGDGGVGPFDLETKIKYLRDLFPLGYNAASSGNPLLTFRDNVLVPSSRVKKSWIS
jgi:hypothetical protein